MLHRKITMVAGALALVFALPQFARAETLISAAEAKLPLAPETGMATRGLTRGPAIEQISPAPTVQNLKSPLPLKIKFTGRNNVAIDPASVRLTYLKAPSVDLTDRIKTHITANGIDMPQAEVPPGVHILRLDVKDSEGRATTATIKLTVAPN
jgi:hypothetical protein